MPVKEDKPKKQKKERAKPKRSAKSLKKDEKLKEILSRNPNLTLKELEPMIGINTSSLSKRIRKLNTEKKELDKFDENKRYSLLSIQSKLLDVMTTDELRNIGFKSWRDVKDWMLAFSIAEDKIKQIAPADTLNINQLIQVITNVDNSIKIVNNTPLDNQSSVSSMKSAEIPDSYSGEDIKSDQESDQKEKKTDK